MKRYLRTKIEKTGVWGSPHAPFLKIGRRTIFEKRFGFVQQTNACYFNFVGTTKFKIAKIGWIASANQCLLSFVMLCQHYKENGACIER